MMHHLSLLFLACSIFALTSCGGGDDNQPAPFKVDLIFSDASGQNNGTEKSVFASGSTVYCRLFITNQSDHTITKPLSFFWFYMDAYTADKSKIIHKELRPERLDDEITLPAGNVFYGGESVWPLQMESGPKNADGTYPNVPNGNYIIRIDCKAGSSDHLITISATG